MIIIEHVDKILSTMLQHNLSFELENKQIRKGKLILYAIKDFHLHLMLQGDKNEIKQFIVPFPFNIRKTDSGIELDYTLDTLANNNSDLLLKLKTLTRKKNTRFFNAIINCKIIKHKL